MKIIDVVIIIGAFTILSYSINLPYTGQHDWNSVMYANIARNHLRYGLLQTKLGMLTTYDRVTPDLFGFFTHYPPLMPLLLALSFFLFGITEWAGRLVPILSSVVMIYFLFKLAQSLWDTRTGILTGIFLVFSPMLLYYSKIPVHETVVLGFLAMTLWFYIRWLKSGSRQDYWLMFVNLLLSQLTSWAGFYLSGYLPVHAIINSRSNLSKRKWFLTGIFILAPVIFILHNLHVFWLEGVKAQQSMFEVMLFRLNIGATAKPYGLTLSSFIDRQAYWINLYFTPIMITLSLIWLIVFISRRASRIKLALPESIIFLLLVFGFTHNLIFRHLAFIHDYMLIYALPFFALSSGVTLNWLYGLAIKKTRFAPAGILVILTTFILAGLPLVKQLFHSGDNNPAYRLGLSLNQSTKSGDTIIITSIEFMRFYDIFLRFYSDRVISATDKLRPSDFTNYDHIVMPKSYNFLSDADRQFLYNHYTHADIAGGTLFDTRQPL